MSRALGIDLGTSNTCVAVAPAGVAKLLANGHGELTTPSMVSIDVRAGIAHPLVGSAAKRRAVSHPEGTIYAVKRLMGRRFSEPDVQKLAQRLPYPVVEAPNGDAWVSVAGEPTSPQQIAALLLREMRAAGERHYEAPIDYAIITVPAYYDNAQRQATKHAAEIAGLSARRLINEPTAAALGYGVHRGANQRFAVCDLGGGTFDVSVVNVESGVIEVIATHGDPFLGGDDFDHVVGDLLRAEFERAHQRNLPSEPQVTQRIRERAQQAKHALSETQAAEVDLPFLVRDGEQSFDLRCQITRTQFEQAAAELLERLAGPCREVCLRCSLSPTEIDGILLVGGMTRMPAVQNRLAEIFGRPPLRVVNPDEIVAMGAATQCALLDGISQGTILLDVTSRTLGIRVGDKGPVQPVIPRNATVPTRDYKILTTTRNDQSVIEFEIFEGESHRASDNRLLGRFAVRDLPPMPAGEVMLVLDVTVGVDGLLSLDCAHFGSGDPVLLHRLATAGLSRSQVVALTQRLRELPT